MEGLKRDGFVFYRSFYDAITLLKKPSEKWSAVEAIIQYALDGTEIETLGAAQMALALVKPQIDANKRRYANGKKGGRKPKQNLTETEAEPNCTEHEPKEKDKVKEKVKDKEKDKDKAVFPIGNTYAHEGVRITAEQKQANLEAIRERVRKAGLTV